MKTRNIRRRQAERYFRYLDALDKRQDNSVLVPWSVVYLLQGMSPRQLKHRGP